MPPYPYDNDTSLLPPTAHFTSGPSPLSNLVRITHNAVPNLSYEVTISPIAPSLSDPNPPTLHHTLAEEVDLINFSTATFSFSNFSPFTAFLSSHALVSIAHITKVQWEARDRFDVAAGSTLTVAKMLLETLPALEEVVVRLVMSRREADKPHVQANKDEWVNGLRGLKVGLKAVVLRTHPEAFEGGGRGRNVRCVKRILQGKGKRKTGKCE